MNATDAENDYGDTLPDPMLLQTALCYLMTRYTRCPCSGLACTIVHRLQLLLAHPDLAGWPELRKINCDLLQHWRGVVTQQSAVCPNGVSTRKGATH
jgi:hypothetical protein